MASRRLYFPHVEGLRGLSALYVFLFHMRETAIDNPVFAWLVHATPFLAFGHYAVSIFIVISGYCLAEPLAAQPERGFDVRAFARRRFRRIYPAYFGALIVSALLFYYWSVPLYHGAEPLSHLVLALATHALLIHNLFHGTSEYLNGPLWSVGLEAQIYVVFALVLVPLWRRFGVWTQLVVAAVAGLVPHCVLGGALDWTCPWFLGLFAIGVCAAHFTHRAAPRVPWKLLAAVVVIAALVVVPVSHPHTLRGGYYGPYIATDFLVGAAVGLFFVAAAGRDGKLWAPARLLALRPFERLGLFSYSIYLLHVVFVFSVYETIVTHQITGVVANLAYLTLIPAVLVIAYGWYRLLERPFMSSRLRAAVESVPEALPSSLFVMPDSSRTT
jgi:peptidoglycan/LPS O-acetylase OafA/YrhL